MTCGNHKTIKKYNPFTCPRVRTSSNLSPCLSWCFCSPLINLGLEKSDQATSLTVSSLWSSISWSQTWEYSPFPSEISSVERYTAAEGSIYLCLVKKRLTTLRRLQSWMSPLSAKLLFYTKILKIWAWLLLEQNVEMDW